MSEPEKVVPPQAVLSGAALEAFVRQLVGTPELWIEHVRDDAGCRTFESVWEDAYVNAWVVCWSDDNDTGFHDHDRSAAAIAVIRGAVREERLTLTGPPLARTFAAGEFFALEASAIHRVRHGGGEPAVTIHAYSPPLERQGVYFTRGNGSLERDVQPFSEELRLSRGWGQSGIEARVAEPGVAAR
jgi:quercetin dioxygenase-like cupin family protein